MLANCHKHVLIADSECNEQSPARPACIWTEALVLMDQQNAGKKTHGIMWHVAGSRTMGILSRVRASPLLVVMMVWGRA